MTGLLALALDTFGKSFRRNIIQRGVKLQPPRSFRTDISIDNVIPKRLWTDASCVRGYPCTCRFRRPFRILRTCPVSKRPFRPSLSLHSPSLSFPFAPSCVGVGRFVFTSLAARINRRSQRAETRFRYSATVWKTL